MSPPPSNVKQELKPDHGENFVPGSEEAPDHMAPQPLDHFKRGYKERADLRDRETNQLANDFESAPTGDQEQKLAPSPPQQQQQQPASAPATTSNTTAPVKHPPVEAQQQQQQPSRQHKPMQRRNNEFRSSYRGATSFDAIRLVDNLCRPGCNLVETLDQAKENFVASFQSGKALTAILSNLARRRKMGIALSVWQWMDQRDIEKNVFHYNSLISVCEKMKDNQRALRLLEEMERRSIQKNEVTFSSAISACEKAGQWRVALDLLERMKKEGVGRTAIAYNAAISACEKGLVPHKALELFEQMKREGVTPTVITYSALISAAEKGQQWKLALEVLEEMKASGHGANVIAYSAAISALSKGQMWEKALELFREIERSGNTPSIVTYNATMTALEKGLQWERALDLFDEMKAKRLPITVVSYGSAISACEKGLQYRQCLEYLDEMTELGIKKNVIIFGAAMSCMEKCCRADIAFQLMERMKTEGVAPNVHIYNSAISACARSGLWQKGLELFEEMEKVGVVRDVVSFNAVLDAVSSQVRLGRRLFELGIEKGFYARVSRLGTQWLELDLHFLSLGGGEIALGWWFEECLVPYLVNTSKLAAVKSIDIVTGYGKTRMRGVRHGDDGMRKRVRAMLNFMKIEEVEQPNKGRIHIDKEALIREVQKNTGKIVFDEESYRLFKEENTTANHIPDVPQRVRPRYRPSEPLPQDNSGRRSSFQRDGFERRGSYNNPRRGSHFSRRGSSDTIGSPDDRSGPGGHRGSISGGNDSYTRRGSYQNNNQNRRGSYEDNSQSRRGSYEDNSQSRRGSYEDNSQSRRGSYENNSQSRRGSYEGNSQNRRGSYEISSQNRRGSYDSSYSPDHAQNNVQAHQGVSEGFHRRGSYENKRSSEHGNNGNLSQFASGDRVRHDSMDESQGQNHVGGRASQQQFDPHQDSHDSGNPHAGRRSSETMDYSRQGISDQMPDERSHHVPSRRSSFHDDRPFNGSENIQHGSHHGSGQYSQESGENQYNQGPNEPRQGSNFSGSSAMHTSGGHSGQRRGSYMNHDREESRNAPSADQYGGVERRGSHINGQHEGDGRRFSHFNDSSGHRNNAGQNINKSFPERRDSERRSSQINEYSGREDTRRGSQSTNWTARETGEYRGRDHGDDADSQTSGHRDSLHDARHGSSVMGDQRGSYGGEKRSYDGGGDRPPTKRRGYEIDSSRASFTGKRGF